MDEKAEQLDQLVEDIDVLLDQLGELGRPVAFAEDCVGEAAAAAVAALKDGDVLMLENTRFHAGEEKNDPAFAAKELQAQSLNTRIQILLARGD